MTDKIKLMSHKDLTDMLEQKRQWHKEHNHIDWSIGDEASIGYGMEIAIDECEKRAFEKVKEQIERFHLWFLNRELAVRHLPKGKFEQLFQQYLKEQNGDRGDRVSRTKSLEYAR